MPLSDLLTAVTALVSSTCVCASQDTSPSNPYFEESGGQAGVGVGVCVGVDVGVGVRVGVAVFVDVGLGVAVDVVVGVNVDVGIDVGGTDVEVGAIVCVGAGGVGVGRQAAHTRAKPTITISEVALFFADMFSPFIHLGPSKASI